MEVIQTAQCFEAVDGMPQFLYTKILYRFEGSLFCARSPQRIPSGQTEADVTSFSDSTIIPVEAYCPQYTSNMTRAPSPLPADCYVKRPNLMAFSPDLGTCDSFVREIHVCEQLKLHPHRNLAHFYGCQVSEGRVVGLCFRRYKQTLMDRINPNHLNKARSLDFKTSSADRYIPMIRDALRQIHSLGYAHNDINPNNIMLDHDDNPVITDFDSCIPFSRPLRTIKRTYGWFDPQSLVSCPDNDWDAMEEIQAWLAGKVEKYKFPE